ncbi:MAG: ATP-binding protein, partial [Gammaproteobacteria bacterium]|nr:ATP-binding protein [Gammaproteobacteria bacterium]
MIADQRLRMQERLTRDTAELTRSLLEKGNASCAFLAHIAPQGLLSYDYLLLEGYVEEMSADPDIIYAVILDSAGKPVTHYLNTADPYFAGQSISPETFEQVLAQARNDDTLIAVEREIKYEGGTLGSARVALSRAKIEERVAEFKTSLQRELRHIALLTGGLILVSLLVLSLLIESAFRRMVVKPIQLLSASMARLQAGDLGARAAVLRDDQIGYLAQRFNVMANELQSQLAETERQARTVQETRDYLAGILDHSADMIATTALDGTIVEFNDAAERILGYRRAEVVGRSSDSIYCDTRVRDRLYATVMDGQPVQGAEIQLRRKDNTLVDIEMTLSPLRDNKGMLVGTVCIGRDVTHARALRRELIQSEKLASIGQVAAWIAHQIRNYLGRLLMAASTLRPADDSTAPRRQAHADLTCTITEMERLVTDLLEYSRDLTLHPTTMNLNSALGSLLDTLASEQPGGKLIIERQLQQDLPPVLVDVFKLEQAFTNVLRNAVQAMPDGGHLRVITRTVAKQDMVAVSIEDSGPGIPASNSSRIFRPFFTTKPGGTGLGLAMALRIVEAHGGTLSVRSVPGEGACFEFTLPCTPITQAAS